MQGIAPSFIGGFSDSAGRRPAYIICFVIYIVADIGLALQTNYPALLVLRMVQSSGSSGTVALSSAVVADIVTSAERGIYIGWTSLGNVLGPSIGPIIGGLLNQFLGWKAIFWFLAIFAAAVFIPMLIFFPETCRKIVGDGTIPPPILNQSVISYLSERRRTKAGIAIDYAKRDALAKDRHLRFPNPFATLKIVFDKEAGLVLCFGSILYAGLYMVFTSLPAQFTKNYGFNSLQNGLVFIPVTAGSLTAAFLNGRVIDYNWSRHAKRLGLPPTKTKQQDLINFPAEKARLEVGLPLVYIGAATMIIYAWVIHFKTNLAGPIISLFVLGYCISGSFGVLQILNIDSYPGKAATVTAAFNLVRCLLGAGATAVVNPILNVLGNGWTYTFVALVWIAFSPMLWIVFFKGHGWRRERQAREEKEKAKQQAKRELIERNETQVGNSNEQVLERNKETQ